MAIKQNFILFLNSNLEIYSKYDQKLNLETYMPQNNPQYEQFKDERQCRAMANT